MNISFDTRLDLLQHAWERNPFDSDLSRANSTYAAASDDGSLVRLLETAKPSFFDRIAHASIRDFILDPDFSCLGAKAALRSNSYRFGTYGNLADASSTSGLARDLFAFATERRGFESTYTTYVAVFAQFDRGADPDLDFESALWRQLSRLYALDREHHAWDSRVSQEPSDSNFSYSFAGTGFFVVGLHPESTRAARRFAWPTLIFNAHEQFAELKSRGQFARLQDRIRTREIALDGSLNPNLADFGDHSEARQYAGRPLPQEWTCPFRR